MSYSTAEYTPAVASIAATLPRDRSGLFLIDTGTRIERTHRADIARLLARGRHGAPCAPVSPRHASALERARWAVDRAEQIVGRTRRAALSMSERAAVDRLPNSALTEVLGATVGRELAERDRRLRALELRASPRSASEVRMN